MLRVVLNYKINIIIKKTTAQAECYNKIVFMIIIIVQIFFFTFL